MNVLSVFVSLILATCVLGVVEPSASATAANITGTWELTIHYPAPDGDYKATYVLKQDGEKITGTYHGLHGPRTSPGQSRRAR